MLDYLLREMKPLLSTLVVVINGLLSLERMFVSYLLHYVLTHTQIQGAYVTYLGISLAFMLVLLIGLGRSCNH